MTTFSYIIDKIHKIISFDNFTGAQFSSSTSLGRIGLTSFLLGNFLGFHFLLLLLSLYVIHFNDLYNHLKFMQILLQWSLYVVSLSSYHFLEFMMVAIYNPNYLSYDSFVINHSKQYTLAAIISWLEFWTESYLFGVWKFHPIILIFGICLVLCGQMIRTLAMSTCGVSFTHIIADRKPRDHCLITHGVYSIIMITVTNLLPRLTLLQCIETSFIDSVVSFHTLSVGCLFGCLVIHYTIIVDDFGWFYWSIGTQLLLCNPICTILYTLAAWKFFSVRIPFEEMKMVEFYNHEYVTYAKRTFIGIPFITSNVTGTTIRKED